MLFKQNIHNKVVLSPAAGTSVPLALHYGPKPRRYEEIMHTIRMIIYIFSLAAIVSCSHKKSETVFLIADDGTKYEVLQKQKLIFKGDKMLVITYLSADPDNESIRNKEFQDLYQITADNINPNSDYDYIGLIALKKRPKSFGVTINSGYRDRRKFSDVLLLRNKSS